MIKKLLIGLGIVCCLLSIVSCDMKPMFESPKDNCIYKETADFIVKSKRTNSYTRVYFMQVGKTSVPMTNTYTDYYVTVENSNYGTHELESQALYNGVSEGTHLQADLYSDGKVAYFKITDYGVESELITIEK